MGQKIVDPHQHRTGITQTACTGCNNGIGQEQGLLNRKNHFLNPGAVLVWQPFNSPDHPIDDPVGGGSTGRNTDGFSHRQGIDIEIGCGFDMIGCNAGQRGDFCKALGISAVFAADNDQGIHHCRHFLNLGLSLRC